LIAALLSLFSPGLGQFYNKQTRKGLIIALFFLIVPMIWGISRVFLQFWDMVAIIAIRIVGGSAVIIDAIRFAGRPSASEKALPGGKYSSYVAILFFVAVLLVESPQFVAPYLRAYRVNSNSMCPTLCQNERIMCDVLAYTKEPVKRGNVVLFLHPGIKAPLIKRVVGLPGDLISASGDEILVNGSALPEPNASCGQPPYAEQESHEPLQFDPVRVPPDSIFLLGDNRYMSYDSRSFGPVPMNRLRGRPVYIYWSPGKGRIGCTIR
jgi:signal peptidase I